MLWIRGNSLYCLTCVSFECGIRNLRFIFKVSVSAQSIRNQHFLPGFGGKLGASFSLLVLLLTKSSLELFKLAPLRRLLLTAMPLLLLMRRFVSTGDVLWYTSTKFDGNTPILPDNFPRHQPSSTSPKNSIISPTAKLNSSLLFCV